MKLHSHSFITELLPDVWLDDDTLLFIDHDQRLYVAKGVRVAGQPMTNLSPEHLAAWRSAAMTMLNSLEISAHLDFHWTIENDYSDFIDGHRRGVDPQAPALARHLLDSRVKQFEDQQRINQLQHRQLFVFVNLEPLPSQIHATAALSRRMDIRRDHRMLMTEWKAARQKLDQIIAMVRHPFESCGMNTFPLENADIQRIYRKLFSPHLHLLRVQQPPYDNRGCLWNETLFSDVERITPFLRFDEHYHAFLSLTHVPQETRTGFLSQLFSLSFPEYTIKLTIRTTDKQKEIQHLQSDYGSKRGLQVSRERNGKPVNIEMETQAEEIRQEIRILTQTPQQVFEVQMLIHLRHPDQAELLRRIDEVRIRMGYCGGMQGSIEKIAAPEALRACLPGWTRENRLDRFHLVKSANAADFIPAHTDFLGTGRPQLLFPTPEEGLMSAHVFTPARPYHSVVVGETGGGKTFLLNTVVTQLVGQGLRSVSVISTKDEFGPLMAIYGGQKIAFSESHPVFLNPCAIAGEKPTLDELAAMTSILETIFGDEPHEGNRKIRQSRILKAAQIGFERHGKQTRLRHLVKTFREGWEHDEPQELKRLAMILEAYAQGGLYGEFFDSNTRAPLDLSAPFKFFDFSGIQKNRNLSSVMMMALTTAEALRLSTLPRHYRKALIFDECWAFVDSVAGGDFIENALRVYRTFNCGVFLSTQIITDFLNSRIAPVVMSNCHNFFLLRTKDHRAIVTLQKELKLTDELVSRFAVMPDPSEAGYSRFIYVHRAESSQIAGEGLNRIGRAEALLYSTSPNISQLRDHALRSAADPWQAICNLARMTTEEIRQKNESLFHQTTP
ncbi:MAG: ATP-binding protein [Verrucomicrobiae bacterium]|nr:ATP-binding protein [Verrucomicrobiae bacterium]